MAGNALEILNMSRFCERSVFWNGVRSFVKKIKGAPAEEEYEIGCRIHPAIHSDEALTLKTAATRISSHGVPFP